MPKVLFVATVVREHINVFHIPFLKLFKEAGWETSVAARNDYFDNPNDCVIPYCDTYYDIPFERSPFSPKNLNAYRQLKMLISAGTYDIIHCHTPVGAMLTRLAARKERNNNKTKVFYTAHGFHFYKGAPALNWLLFYPVERFLAYFTDVLITINGEDYNCAKNFKAKKIEYVPGVGIDEKRFCTNIDICSDLRKELHIDESTFIVVSIGELIKRKNFTTLIDVMEKIREENVICLICGKGVLENKLQAYVKEKNLEDKVRFLGFRKDISRILYASDVFVFPSFQEGLPVAVMEAMGSGKPIIASNIRGTNDLVKDNINGYLLAPKDVDSYAERILYLMQNRKMLSTMGEASIEMIKPYTLDKVCLRMQEIYFGKRQ